MPTDRPNLRPVLIGSAIVLGAVALGLVLFYIHRVSEAQNRQLEAGYRYDDSAIRRVDPTLIKYLQIKQIPTEMTIPAGIAIVNGQLAIIGDNQVCFIDDAGKVARRVDLAASPQAVAAGKDGSAIVALANRFQVIPREGAATISATLPPGTLITSIATRGDQVWLADAGRKRIVRCNLEGKIEQELNVTDLLVPSPHLDVAATDEAIWIANPGRHRLEVYSPDGKRQRTWGQFGSKVEDFVGCCNPSDFALLPDGGVITSEKGAARVKAYNTYGLMDCVVADAGILGNLEGSMDIAADAQGRVYVLDAKTKTVRIFQRQGENHD